MEKKFYKITYQWFETDISCSNIVSAESPIKVRAHFALKGHRILGIKEASEDELKTARERGMPFVYL